MLILDEAPSRTDRRPEPPAPPAAGLSIGALVAMLWRRKIAITLAALLGALAAFAFGQVTPPRFASTAQLFIDPRDLQLVDKELTPRGQDSNSIVAMIESQARMITSARVLQRVVERENLAYDPEFVGTTGLFAKLMQKAGLRTPPVRTVEGDRANAQFALDAKTSVRREDRTYVVDITVATTDPEKSARLANALAEAFLEEERAVRAEAARRATASLSGRLDELKERVRAAETRVEEYKARNNLVVAKGQLVTEQQLSEINAQLVAARARRADAEARYQQIEAARRAGAASGAISEAINSQTVATLRAQFAELKRRRADLVSELGERHPQLRSIEAQSRDLQRLIDDELQRIAQSARNDVERAKALETSIARSLDTLKLQSIDTGAAYVELRELEREVEASRAVYQAFLNRARETGEQERLNPVNARIITPATPPNFRSFPPRQAVLILLGLVAGAGLGAGGALLPALLTTAAPVTPAPAPVGAPRGGAPANAGFTPLPAARRRSPAVVARLTGDDVLLRPAAPPARGRLDMRSLGWPTLKPGREANRFAPALKAWRQAGTIRQIRLVGRDPERVAVAALNIALAAARDEETVALVVGQGSPLTQAAGLAGAPRPTLNGVTLCPPEGGLPEADLIVAVGAPAAEDGAAVLLVLSPEEQLAGHDPGMPVDGAIVSSVTGAPLRLAEAS